MHLLLGRLLSNQRSLLCLGRLLLQRLLLWLELLKRIWSSNDRLRQRWLLLVHMSRGRCLLVELLWHRLSLVQHWNLALLGSLLDGCGWHLRCMLLNHLRIDRLLMLQRNLLVGSLGLRLRGQRDRLGGGLLEGLGLLLLGDWQRLRLVTLLRLSHADRLIPLIAMLSESLLLLLVRLILRMRVLRCLMLHDLLRYLLWLLHNMM